MKRKTWPLLSMLGIWFFNSVALTAHRMDFTIKIRYVKSFLPRYGL